MTKQKYELKVNLDAGQEQSDLVVGCNFLFEFLAGTHCKHNYKLEINVKK
jgi:hypothetical protein